MTIDKGFNSMMTIGAYTSPVVGIGVPAFSLIASMNTPIAMSANNMHAKPDTLPTSRFRS